MELCGVLVSGAFNVWLLFLKIIRVLSESVTEERETSIKKNEKHLFVSLFPNPPFPKGPYFYPAAASIPQKVFYVNPSSFLDPRGT